MSVQNKLRALLNLTGHKLVDLSDGLGVSPQAVRNKFTRDSFSVPDLIKICDALECTITLTTKDGQSITLTMDDIN